MKKTAIIAFVAISVAGPSHAWGSAEQAGLAGLFLGVVIGNQSRSSSGQQPNVVYQQPNVVYQQPNVVYQQPNVVYQQPNVVYQQPNVVYQQPNVVYQQPNVVYQQPNVVYQQQSITVYRAAHASHIDRLPRGWCGVLAQDQYGNRVSVRCN